MAATGIPIGGWSDFIKVTGMAVLTSPESFVNESDERNYFTEWLMNSTSAEERLQGGQAITDFSMTEDGSTATNTHPGATRTVDIPQVFQQMTANWRLTEDVMAYNAIIRDLNEGGGGGLSGRYQQLKSEQRKEEVRVATSYSNKFERDLFMQPDATTMQGTGLAAVNPEPIWSFLNEYGADDLIFDATEPQFPSGNSLPAGYTTLQTRDPAVDKWFRCWQVPYAGSVDTTTVNPLAAGFIKAATQAINLVKYKRRPWRPQAGAENTAMNNPEYVIPVSINGDAYIQKIWGSAQNYFRMDPQDPFYPAVTFAGIPFLQCAAMDRAAVYPTTGHTSPAAGAGATEYGATVDIEGPRFPLISGRWLKWVFHSKYYFYLWPERSPSKQWDLSFIPISTLHNRYCRSRRRMAFIYPSANIVV